MGLCFKGEGVTDWVVLGQLRPLSAVTGCAARPLMGRRCAS